MSRLRRLQLLQILLALVVMEGFVMALAMEASPELHHQIHHDSDDDDHDCLATQLLHGGLESVLVACVPILLEQVSRAISWAGKPIRISSFFLRCSIYEHAPPTMA